jgi:hypothetical protein
MFQVGIVSQCREEHDPDPHQYVTDPQHNFSILICRQWCNCGQVHIYGILEPVTNGVGYQDPYIFGLSGFVKYGSGSL